MRLIATQPRPGCRLSIAVPACNEADHLPSTLEALGRQSDQYGRRLASDLFEVVVLVNNSTDQSAALCRQYAAQHADLVLHVAERQLPRRYSAAGHARRLLMEECRQRFATRDPLTSVIASLDADTRVAPDWVSAILAAVSAGAQCVAGRVFVDPDDRRRLPVHGRRALLQRLGYDHLLAEWEARLDPVPWDPWPRHRQHLGASLALTVDAYVRAGGLPRTAEHEDVLLYQAVQRIDARVRHSPDVRVWTSGRLTSRAQEGFASQLARWCGERQEPGAERVEHPATTLERMRLRHRLRRAWASYHSDERPLVTLLTSLANEIRQSVDSLLARVAAAGTFGILSERLLGYLEQCYAPRPTVAIGDAIMFLRSQRQVTRSRS